VHRYRPPRCDGGAERGLSLLFFSQLQSVCVSGVVLACVGVPMLLDVRRALVSVATTAAVH